MKRLFLPLFFLAMVYTLMIYLIVSVDCCNDLLIIDFKTSASQLDAIYDFFGSSKNIVDFCIYIRKPGQTIRNTGRNVKSVNNISIYVTDESMQDFHNINMIEGRFIWDTDSINNKRYIVLERETAVELFSTTECIGRSVSLNNENYAILGVYDAKKTLLNEISSIEYAVCFIPLIHDSPKADSFISMLRVKEESTYITNNALRNYFQNTLGLEVNLDNTGAKIKTAAQKIKLVNMFVALLILVYLFGILKSYFKKLAAGIKSDYKNYYPAGLINAYKYKIIFVILQLFIMMCIIYYFADNMFSIFISPTLIPGRLINFDEFYHKIKDFMIEVNTSDKIPSVIALMADYINIFINYLVIIFVGCTIRIFSILRDMEIGKGLYKERENVITRI